MSYISKKISDIMMSSRFVNKIKQNEWAMNPLLNDIMAFNNKVFWCVFAIITAGELNLCFKAWE